LTANGAVLKGYYESQKDRLNDQRIRIVEAMRFKIMLLCYLMIVPRSLGFLPWTPFLDIEIAFAMLNLPDTRRHNRVWQVELFKTHGLDIENMGLSVNRNNILDYVGLRRQPLNPLESQFLKECVKPAYIEWINRHLHRLWIWNIVDDSMYLKKIDRVVKRLGLRRPQDSVAKAYTAYLILKPIENLLRRRNACVAA